MVTKRIYMLGLIITIMLFSFSVLTKISHATMSQHHVPVIVYHEIVTEESREGGETVISLEKFSKQMEYLYRNGFGTLNMDELVEFMKRETEIEKSVAIHFDDGWKNLKHAIPVLEKYGFKASFWIITEKGIGNDYLEWDDIIALDRSPQFGVFSHTMSHPWDSKSNLITWTEGKVPGKGLKDAEWEIRESKRVLEVRLKKEIPYLAWPVGWYNKTLIRLAVDAGYEALMTTDDGFNIPGDDVLRIKRVMINGACSMSVFKSILQNPRYHDCRERPKIAEEYSRISNSDL